MGWIDHGRTTHSPIQLRVQQYIQKLKKAQGKEAKRKCGNSRTSRRHSVLIISTATMRVDKDAAARFIKSAISEGASENQKATADKKRKLEETVSISSDEDEDDQPAKKDAFSNHASK